LLRLHASHIKAKGGSNDKGENIVKIRSAQWLLFVAIVASAGAVQIRQHLVTGPAEADVATAPSAGGVQPSARCMSARPGLHTAACGKGVDAARRANGAHTQSMALWV
jgi:hypothetical protein